MLTIKMKDGDFIREQVDCVDNRWKHTFITGVDAVTQRINNRLKLFVNEWFMQPDEGVDWFGVFEKPFTIRKMETEIYRVLSNDNEIESIEEIKIEPDFKNRSIKINIELKAGEQKITINEEMQD